MEHFNKLPLSFVGGFSPRTKHNNTHATTQDLVTGLVYEYHYSYFSRTFRDSTGIYNTPILLQGCIGCIGRMGRVAPCLGRVIGATDTNPVLIALRCGAVFRIKIYNIVCGESENVKRTFFSYALFCIF